MRFSSSIFVLGLSFAASALPVKRAASPDEADNILVLQFADVLNHLENQFYTQALSQFQESDFVEAGFSNSQLATQILQAIAGDESNHFNFIESAITSIGGSIITGCNFDFSSALTDVDTMLDTARIVENVGVGAFLGGATLVNDNVILDSAATILTVEARHQTMLNVLNLGSAIPQSFDIPLSPSEVLAIAGPFISGCNLGIPANPSLDITNTGPISPGTQLSFSSSAINNGSTDNLFCQMLVGGQPAAIPMPFNNCVVPAGINGPSAIFITSDGQPLLNNVIDRATSQLVAGPTMVFIDSQTQTLGQVARPDDPNEASSSPPSSSPSGGSDDPISNPSTTTISGPALQSIIQSASATATASGNAPPPSSTSTSTSTSSSPPSDGSALPGENTTQGPIDGGAVTVNGWETVTSIPVPGSSD